MYELESHSLNRCGAETNVLQLHAVDVWKAFDRVAEYLGEMMLILMLGKYVPYCGNGPSNDILDRKDKTGISEEGSDSNDEDSNGMMACKREYVNEMNKDDSWPYQTE